MRAARTSPTPHESSGPTRLRPAHVALSLGVALAVTLLTGLLDGERVVDPAQQAHLSFGWPWAWLTQDARNVDPPLPHRLGPGSPWERPTDVHGAPFWANVLVWWAASTVSVHLATKGMGLWRRRVRA
jgi:hypothetical protein